MWHSSVYGHLSVDIWSFNCVALGNSNNNSISIRIILFLEFCLVLIPSLLLFYWRIFKQSKRVLIYFIQTVNFRTEKTVLLLESSNGLLVETAYWQAAVHQAIQQVWGIFFSFSWFWYFFLRSNFPKSKLLRSKFKRGIFCNLGLFPLV